MAIAFAFLSMACAAALDLALKHRSRAGTSPGRQLILIGAAWSIVSLVPVLCAPVPWTGVSLACGLISGIFGLAANLLLLLAMRGCEIGTCATVYRLNLVPATILAVVALDETMTAGKAAAVTLAVGAVLLMASWRIGNGPRFLAAAVIACLLRACMALAYREGVVAGADAGCMLVVNGVVWLAGAAWWAAAREGWRGRFASAELRWGLGVGLLATGSAAFLAQALARAPVTAVLPISQLSFVATTLAACLLLGERLTRRKAVALGLAAGAIGILALP